MSLELNKSKITALSFCLRDSPENRGYTFGALLKRLSRVLLHLKPFLRQRIKVYHILKQKTIVFSTKTKINMHKSKNSRPGTQEAPKSAVLYFLNFTAI